MDINWIKWRWGAVVVAPSIKRPSMYEHWQRHVVLFFLLARLYVDLPDQERTKVGHFTVNKIYLCSMLNAMQLHGIVVCAIAIITIDAIGVKTSNKFFLFSVSQPRIDKPLRENFAKLYSHRPSVIHQASSQNPIKDAHLMSHWATNSRLKINHRWQIKHRRSRVKTPKSESLWLTHIPQRIELKVWPEINKLHATHHHP